MEVVIVKEISSLSLRWDFECFWIKSQHCDSSFLKKVSGNDKDCHEKIISLDATMMLRARINLINIMRMERKRKKLTSTISDYIKLLNIDKYTLLQDKLHLH